MSAAAVFEYCQSIDTALVLEFYYNGEKIDDPDLYFDLHPGLFEKEFPTADATKAMINQCLANSGTHKLVVSEYGLSLVIK